MSGIDQMHLCVGQIPLKGLRPIIFTPNGQQWDLYLLKVFLEPQIQGEICHVILKRVELNIVVTRPLCAPEPQYFRIGSQKPPSHGTAVKTAPFMVGVVFGG
jgi:hypothetical protein